MLKSMWEKRNGKRGIKGEKEGQKRKKMVGVMSRAGGKVIYTPFIKEDNNSQD